MIGLRAGLKAGVRPALAVGLGADPLSVGSTTNPMAGVPRDATSNIYRPSNLAQWQTTLAAAGVTGDPFFLWKCDEASGNLADSIGSLTSTTSGTAILAAYRQAIPGWAALGLQLANDAGVAFFTSDASLPDIGTGDLLLMGSAYIPNPGPATTPTTAVQIGSGFGTDATLQMNTTPRLIASTDGGAVLGTVNPLGQATPFAVLVDRTNARAMMATKQEVIVPAVGGSGKGIRIGGDFLSTWLSSGWIYWDVVAFAGVSARKSNANIKSIWQTLGWSVAW